MGKSKYPSQIDSSVELPAVRGNILEIGSEVIDSLRSAILQIERTLGVNPQGASGNTVSDRLNKITDGNGNLKKDSLLQANILAGPISDSDISKVASIKEAKLKLDFPTKILQSEISILTNQIDSLIAEIESLSSIITVHVHPDVSNRHRATSISVIAAEESSSSVATRTLNSANVQSALVNIYDSHINYDGGNITSENNSHSANQVYFDNTEVAELVSANNVQDAIETGINIASVLRISHQDLYHTDGIKRVSKMYSPTDSSAGTLIFENEAISFSSNVGNSEPSFTVTIVTPYSEDDDVLKISAGDVLTISDENNADSLINGDYQIFKINTDIDGKIESVEVFGTATENSTAGTVGTVRKKFRRDTNEGSLLVAARQSSDLTSSSVLQVCSPNAVRVISKNIKPAEITATSKIISINVDEADEYEFDVYNAGITRQTIESIIQKINEKVAEDKIPLMCYRLDRENDESEIIIAHNYEDDLESTHTLRVVTGGNGVDALGFSHIEGEKVIAEYGTPFSINGVDRSSLSKKMDTTALSFSAGTRIISTTDSISNFEEIGIREGDVILISGAEDGNDNGAYSIESVTSTTLTIDVGQLPTGFSSQSSDGIRFLVYDNTLSLDSLTFKEVSGSFSAALVEIIMDKNYKIFGNTIVEYMVTLNGTNALYEVVDCKGNLQDLTLSLDITRNSSGIGVDVSFDDGDEIYVIGKDNFLKLKSKQHDIELTILIDDADEVYSWLNSNLAISTTIYIFKQFDRYSNLHLATVPFGSFNGRVIGGAESSGRVNSRPEKGSIGIRDINTEAKFQLLERPVKELRSNGVVNSLNISNVALSDGKFAFDLSSGVFYVGGRRFVYNEKSYITDLDSATYDKIFIYADFDGNIKFEPALSSLDCAFPASDSDVVVLYSLEYDGVNTKSFDLRLFINDLDLKVLNAITVSNQPGMGHFSDFRKALDYAKRFSQIYPKAGTPSIHFKSGTYEIIVEHNYATVTGETYSNWLSNWTNNTGTTRSDYYDAVYDAGLLIDFPVTITGEGNSTIFKLRNRFSFSNVTNTFRGVMTFVGSAFARTTKNITAPTNGFTFVGNIRFEQCRIDILDYNIYNADGDPQFYGIDIESCIFDLGEETDSDISISFGNAAILIGEESDTTNFKGNIVISKCKFLKGKIKTGSFTTTSVSRINNIHILFCSLYGAEDEGLTLGDIFSLSSLDRPEKHNILFVGNQHLSNLNTLASGDGPDMIDGSSAERWGERFSRDINVGANAYVKGSAYIDEVVDAAVSVDTESFVYKTTKTFSQIITFENHVNGVSGPGVTSSNNITFNSVLNVSSGTWWYAEIPTLDSAFLRINPPSGSTIKGISLGVSRGATSADQYDWTIELHAQAIDASGNTSVYGPHTVTSTESAGSTEPVLATFLNIGELVNSDDNIYWLEILHDQGTTQEVYWIKIVYDIDTIEEALGIS